MATVIPLICLAVIVFALAVTLRSLRKRPAKNPTWPPYPLIHASGEEMQRRRIECRDRLSHAPFGRELAEGLWKALQQCDEDSGLIHQFHRDYCGHGLLRRPEGIVLCEVEDGGSYSGSPLATWKTETDFVGFFARQSDFSCSGWDEREPVFHTTDEWNRDNQRLTAAIIRKFIKDSHKPRLS
ncbi:hypothetical protein [Pararhizobium arenae]|uniref:hypothetical protein n=1 Tax=Pararhizobium arenae TaxID=1856850 RepID=UPI00094B5AAA|nr:hypothetical protein [Pararhizobium arenae]